MPITELPSIDSTNNYALAKVHAGLAQHGMAFFAHEQVQGKGQRGKSWSSGKDTSVILSVVVNPKALLLSQQFHLSACVAVSVYEFFSRYAGDDTAIKWPNDLYWQDRKAGGILIESVIGAENQKSKIKSQNGQSEWRWSVIGIGININQANFPEELKNPVSLKQITGKEFDSLELAKQICGVIDKNLNLLSGDGGFKRILSLYNDHLYKRNEKVKLKKGNRVFEATIKGVSETGRLITEHGVEEEFGFGEVEWVIGNRQ